MHLAPPAEIPVPAIAGCRRAVPRASDCSRKSISSSGKSSVASTSMPQPDDALDQIADRFREGAGQRLRGRFCSRFGRCVDQVGDRFGLRQIELVVEEGAMCKFAGLGQAQSDLRTPLRGSAPAIAASRSGRHGLATPAHLPRYRNAAPENEARCRDQSHCLRRRETAGRVADRGCSGLPHTAAMIVSSCLPETRTIADAAASRCGSDRGDRGGVHVHRSILACERGNKKACGDHTTGFSGTAKRAVRFRSGQSQRAMPASRPSCG